MYITFMHTLQDLSVLTWMILYIALMPWPAGTPVVPLTWKLLS